MRFRKFLTWFVSVVVLSLAVNLASSYLDANDSGSALLGLEAVVGVGVIGLLACAATWFNGRRNVRYAVSAFVLNKDGCLLVYEHPHHGKTLQPGGRLRPSELPHEAVAQRLESRLGLSPARWEFDRRFHKGLDANQSDLGRVERVPAPFFVQREHVPQRGGIRTHYDFIYVLRMRDDQQVGADSRYSPVRFVSQEALESMQRRGQTFPDLVEGYRRVLAQLETDSSVA